MRVALFLALACLATPAWAHDFWVQPRRFWIPPQSAAPASIQIGHGQDRSTWAIRAERLLRLQSLGPDGSVVDHRARVRNGADVFVLPLRGPGVHVVSLETNHAESNLIGPRFNAYLEEEGLTPAQRLREQTGRTGDPGREIYSRRSKALIQVGPGVQPQPHVTRPVGLTLEIVPQRDPYTLKSGESLPVQVLYEGRPLAGALVKLTDLSADVKPVETHRTDEAGRTSFQGRTGGEWLLTVVWTKPIEGNPRADFDTTFSSLTFGFSGAPAR
jgi:hypothetical protein